MQRTYQNFKRVCVVNAERGKMCARVTIGSGFASDWLRKWHELFKPITKRSIAKPKQTRITVYDQGKTVPNERKAAFACMTRAALV